MGKPNEDAGIGTYYIQHPAGDCVSIPDQSFQGVVKALHETNWEKELEDYKKLGTFKGLPPSLFLGVIEDALFAHIMITARGSANIFYSLRKAEKLEHRFLWKRWYTDTYDQAEKENFTFADVEKIIAAHMKQDRDELARLLGQ
jgi:hypothetical protein